MNHSINIAAKRSGLSPHVIRVWEKRYSAVAPVRTETNRRQYSDEEIERLVLLKQATDAGYKISQIAPVSTENLKSLLEKDRQESDPQPAPAGPPDDAHKLVDDCLAAIRALNPKLLEEHLTQAALSLGHQGMIRRVVAPLAVQIGTSWRAGEITAAHEHFASAIIRVFLTNISKPFAIPATAPRITIATPCGQLHEMGAIIASATSASAGWQVTYLGTNLPASEIAGAAVQNQSQVVALSLVFPEDDPQLPEELERLRTFLPDTTRIVVGGRASAAYQTALKNIDAIQCADLESFSQTLDQLRSGK